MTKNYECILFDLVGVLVEPRVIFENTYLEDNNISYHKFFKNWSDSKAVDDFESGVITEEEFAKARVNELDISISHETFLSVLRSMKTSLYNGVEEFLSMLTKKNITLACLSNTNSIHWQSIENREVFDKYFVKKLLSFKIGFTKPHKEIYLHAINSLSYPADKIIFFDDIDENVKAARSCGLNAVCVSNFDDLKLKVNEII
jgi:putative hydrolase of the HAD superfamily